MIVLRRLLAVLLVVLFIPLFLLTLVVFRVNATLLEPDFYLDQLQKADIYNFLYGDWVAAEVDESLQDVQDPPVSKLLTGQEAVSFAKRIAPPEWLQGQAEQVIGQVLPYITGEQDGFTITVQLQERADAALEVLRDFAGDPDTYDFALDEVVATAVRDNLGDTADMPFGLHITDQQVVDAVREVAPQEWVRAQVDNIVDTVGPYITGHADSFTLTVQLQDRAEAALSVMQRFLRDADIYDFVFDQVIGPGVQENLGSAVQLPFGVAVTGQEVVDAVKGVVTQEWVQAQVDNVIDTAGPYIIGRQDTFALTVELADRKEAAIRVIDDLADQKLRELYESLPPCTVQQIQELLRGGFTGGVPVCVPPGFTYEQLKQVLNIDVTGQVALLVADQLPDSFTLTDSDLRQTLIDQGNADAVELLDDVREVLRDGWTFTEADLRRQLAEQGGTEAVERLDDVRKALREGWTFTEADFQRFVTEQDEQGGTEALQQLDKAREQLGLARGLMPLGFLVLAVFPVLIGFLGGQGWWGRLRWASAAFALVAAVTMTGTIVAQGYIHELVDLMDLPGDLPVEVATKIREMGTTVPTELLGGVERQALTYLIIGIVGLVGSVVGSVLVRRRAWRP